MKKATLFLVLMAGLFCLPVFAQNTFEYTYDAAGNRTKRKLIILVKSLATKSVSDTITDESIASSIAPETEEEVAPQIEKLQSLDLLIYPNPTKGLLKVKLKGDKTPESVLLQVFDIRGRLVLEKKGQETNYDLDLSQQVAGTYILVAIIDGEKLDWKIIKQ